MIVPVSYAQPERGALTLRLARARAAGAAPDAPPLVVLPGDPGADSVTDVAAIAAALPRAITDHFSIVTLDPRGTGQSAGVACVTGPLASSIIGMAPDPTSTEGRSQFSAITRQLTFDCGDDAGPGLTMINSTAAADDLDTIRAALGVPALSLLAAGGGATIGAVYAHRYPGRVGSLVLQSPDDPTATPEQHAAGVGAAAEQAFDDFAAACAGFSGGCPLGADPRKAVTTLTSRFATSGVRVGKGVMTGGTVLRALEDGLPYEERWPSIAAALAALGHDDAAPLSTLVESGGADAVTERLTGRILYTCSDSTDRLGAAAIDAAVQSARKAAPLFGPYAVATAALCADWPAPDEPLGRLTGSGAAPILVIGSVRGIAHPYGEARSVAAQLASATLVSTQSARADAYPGGACLNDAIDAYLVHSAVPTGGLLCPE